MMRRAFIGSAAALAVLVASAVGWADDKSDLQGAVQKLGDAANYSWTTTVEGGFGAGKTDGMTEKQGYTSYSVTSQDASYPIVTKGEKTAAKMDTGWMSMPEIQKAADDAGGFSPELIVTFRVAAFKAPAAQAKEFADKMTNIKKTDDGYTADLPEAAAKELMTFRRPAGAAAANFPEMTVKNAKATLKFWLKDGVLSKMQVHLTGSRSFGDQDMDVDTTTTTEIKDVGTTKLTVPEEAKKKVDGAAATKAG